MPLSVCKAPNCDKPPAPGRKDLCDRHYKFLRKYGSYEPPAKRVNARCVVDGCDAAPRSKGSSHCEKHYNQIRRNGHIGPIARPDLIDHSAGYKWLKAPMHQLTTPGQRFRVYEHRAEFHKQYGDGPFKCYSCDAPIDWDNMCVCRLDEDKAHNAIGNLVPACVRCRNANGITKLTRWARANRSTSIEWRGKIQPIGDWAEELGIPVWTLKRRIRDWPLDLAMRLPLRSRVRRRQSTKYACLDKS